MKVYKAQKFGNLMVVKTCLRGPEATAYPKMLVDTGSVFTIVAQEILESVGCSPASAKERKRIVTVSGYQILPVVQVLQFGCLGHFTEDYPMIAYTLPFGTYVNGLLGMDFLSRYSIDIRPYSDEILVRDV